MTAVTTPSSSHRVSVRTPSSISRRVPGSDDTIVFDEAVFADLDAVIAAAEQQGDDVLITANDDDALLLKGVNLSQLHEDDFRFVA